MRRKWNICETGNPNDPLKLDFALHLFYITIPLHFASFQCVCVTCLKTFVRGMHGYNQTQYTSKACLKAKEPLWTGSHVNVAVFYCCNHSVAYIWNARVSREESKNYVVVITRRLVVFWLYFPRYIKNGGGGGRGRKREERGEKREERRERGGERGAEGPRLLTAPIPTPLGQFTSSQPDQGQTLPAEWEPLCQTLQLGVSWDSVLLTDRKA